MAPRVPIRPEPVADLRTRYRAAITELLDHRQFLAHPLPVPSASPVHVFDTDDGLRLIVSLERLLDGRVGVHFSASFHGPCRSPFASAAAASAWIVARWQAISGSTEAPELLCVTGGGIPHFFVERRH